MYVFRFVFILACCAALSACVTEYKPTPDVSDLPMPPGFSIVEDQHTVFDTPAGRVIQTRLQGTGSVKGTQSFYDQVLPELGWNKISFMSYTREREKLQFAVSEVSEGVAVDLTIKPIK